MPEIKMTVNNELSKRLSTSPMEISEGPQILNNTSSTSNNDQQQPTDMACKNSLHVRNEVTNTVPRKKAKLLRLERKRDKLLAQGKTQSEIESMLKEKKQQNCAKSLEELFDEVYTGSKKLEVIQYQRFIRKIIAYFAERVSWSPRLS